VVHFKALNTTLALYAPHCTRNYSAGFTLGIGRVIFLTVGTESVAPKEAIAAMCYSRRDYGFEEKARRLREKGTRGRRREQAARTRRAGEREQKPLTERVREIVVERGGV
jgi:hypothetical protein